MNSGTWIIPPDTHPASRIAGACVCGAVRWSYDAPFTAMVHCHCGRCRKHHGSAFATVVGGPLTTFHWRSGTEQISTWRSSDKGGRSFCSICGSKVPVVDHATRQVFMPAGALDGELGIRPQMHIFVGALPPWLRVTDGLPKHDAYPPEWGVAGLPDLERDRRAGVTSGSCGCGRVRFEISGRPFRMHHCHCSRCRRARGGAYSTNAIYKGEGLRFTQGREWLVAFDLPEARVFGTAFCKECGSFMPQVVPARGAVVVPIGCLDSDPETHPLGHQFVASKAPWFEITDGAPQFAEAAPAPGAK